MDKQKSSEQNLRIIEGKTIALVADGFINGLGIARSLKQDKETIVAILTNRGSALSYSNTVDAKFYYDNEAEFMESLLLINSHAKKVVPFYCSDWKVRFFQKNKEALTNFSIPDLDLVLLEKGYQMETCRSIGIDVPRSWLIDSLEKIDFVEDGVSYIIKPLSQKATNTFKTKITSDKADILKYSKECIDSGTYALVSKYIEGDDRSLVAGCGYAYHGKILLGFTGRKISQRPKSNGVASIAENIDDPELLKITSRFIEKVNYTGIFQIEFKKDNTGKYNFIEINTRNWSWGYVATISGKNLALKKFYTEANVNKEIEEKGRDNFYFWGEGLLYNIIIDRWPSVVFRFLNLAFKKRISYAIFSKKDPLPFFISIRNLILYAVGSRPTKR